MQCSTHSEQEAIDACRSCGKPLCAACLELEQSARCPHCADQTPDGPDSPSRPDEPPGWSRPFLAVALGLICPGLGQIYNREAAKGVLLALWVGVLIWLGTVDRAVLPFTVCVWLYQLLEAWYTARGNRQRSDRPGSAARAWGLVAVGGALLAINLKPGALPGPAVILPLALIALGIRLVFTYFHAPGEGER